MNLSVELRPLRSRPLAAVVLWGVVLHELVHAVVARRWGEARIGWVEGVSWWRAPAACRWAIADAPDWAPRVIHGAPLVVLPLATSWTWLVATVVASGVSALTAVVLAWSLANVWVLAVGGPRDLLGLAGR